MASLHIRTRLLLIFLGLQVLLATVFSVSVYWFFSIEHMAEEDRNLRDRLHTLAASYDWADGQVVFGPGRQRGGALWADCIARISAPTGETLYCNRAADSFCLPLPAPIAHAPDDVPVLETVDSPDQGSYRTAWMIDRHHGTPLVISVAASLDRLKAEQRDLIAVMLPTGGGVLALSAVLGWVTITRLLRPLRRITKRVRRITADRLTERLVVHNPHDEIGELTTTLNDMIGRLHAALDQARRFSSDASHELRTPLACIRTELESLALRVDIPGDYAESVGAVLEELQRLTHLLDALLTLAQLDAGQVPLQVVPVDVNSLVMGVAERIKVQAEAKGASLACDTTQAPCVARADQRLLGQAVLNLVDNAIKHGGDQITIGTAVEGVQVVIRVHDSGPAIPPEHLPHLFDRFYRADKSRSRKLGSVGLGLSLTKQWVEMQGGNVEASSESAKGTIFTLRIPADGSSRRIADAIG